LKPLHEHFVVTAKRMGRKPAIVDTFTQKTYSYERLLIAALLLADKMKKQREGFVGVMLPTGAGSMISVLGIVMAGKVPVMINYSSGGGVGGAMAVSNCEYAQRKCGFHTIISARAFLEKIGCPQVPGMILIEDLIAEIGKLARVGTALKCKLPTALLLRSLPKIGADDTVVILFTSGSEKEPKAVQLSHRNLGSNISDAIRVFGISQEDVFLANLPLFHVFGHTVVFWLPLLCGCTAVSYPNPLEYRTVCQVVRDQKVTLMVGTPAFFGGYLRQSREGDFASVRIAVSGADKLPDGLRQTYWERHRVELLEGYGTTETSPVISANAPGAHKPGSIGRVFPSVQVRIVDIHTNEPLPAGREGKILVKGDLVMTGYFDDIEETSLRIRDGWYETGDMGMLGADGYLWHRGRLKRFVKIAGEMVSLVKVEAVLDEVLDDEEIESAVVELPDSIKGARLVAVVTRPIDERQLIRKMAEKLPAIALPKQFVVLDSLPKMGSGKADFRTLTERIRQMLAAE
jgi:acyl-[acyl-carrier-protein]-phospholipid O-acyltransferase / long-chain-fatty-acid--[acyl-carrier-protein] ligase